MIKPILEDDAFLSQVRSADPGSDSFQVWWLGQSGFLVHWKGSFLLLDPYLSDSLTEKYRNTDKPHVRMTERVVAPGRLDFILLATSSHNHTDHLDKETLGPLIQANPGMQLIVPEANREFAAKRLECPVNFPIGLDAGQSHEADPFRITAIPAAHNDLDRDEKGRHPYLGYVVEFGPWTLYHSGDTLRYEGMEDWLKRWDIDLAILPINGNRPERKVAGNLWGREAAQLAHDIGARTAVPCHFEMFEFNTESPREFIESCERLNQPYRVLRAGELWRSEISNLRSQI